MGISSSIYAEILTRWVQVECQPSGPRGFPGPRKYAPRNTFHPHDQHVLERLRRVEALLGIKAVELSRHDDANNNNQSAPSPASPAATADEPELRSRSDLVDLGDIGPQDTVSRSPLMAARSPQAPALEDAWSTAARALESVCHSLRTSTALYSVLANALHMQWPDLAEDITVRIAPAGTSFRQHMKQSSRCIWLPPREEAEW